MGRTFSDYDVAMKMRDMIEKAALNVVDRVRPKHRYAVVQTVNMTSRRCEVKFTGEGNLISVPFGGLVPIPGQRVRIGGTPGDYFVDDIIGRPLSEYIPKGGASGSYLKKTSASDFAMSWMPEPGEKVYICADNEFASTTPIDNWPTTVSLMSASQTADPGWPAGIGMVMTIKRGTVRARQLFFVPTSNDIWIRPAHNSFGGDWWGPWESLQTVLRPDDYSVDRAMTAGNWYRIARIEGVDNGGWDRAFADFEITSMTSGVHEFCRMGVGAVYSGGGSANSIALHDYTSYASNYTSLCLARIVAPGGTYGGAFFEIKAARNATIRIRIKHGQWPDSNMRWVPVWQSANSLGAGVVMNQVGLQGTTQWYPLGLKNSWVNYGGGYPSARFTMLPGSLVKLSGLVRNGTIGTGTPICTLPEGCRPGGSEIYPSIGGGNALARVDALTNGDISVVAGANGFISLDAIQFVAEQ